MFSGILSRLWRWLKRSNVALETETNDHCVVPSIEMYLSPVVEQDEEESYYDYKEVESPADQDGITRGKSSRVFKFPTAGSFTVKLKRQARNIRGNGEKTDPFQFFEVQRDPCYMLTVRVIEGRQITKGRFGDLMDVPDPYVVVYVPESPDGRKSTKHIDNDPNPHWNERLQFYIDCRPKIAGKLVSEITLMDSNYSVDEYLGSIKFDLSEVPESGPITKTFRFFETSEVDIEFEMQTLMPTDLRCSLALCEEEKAFKTARKRVVYQAMKDLMGFGGPRNLRETPTIAILGSGGGFRAMTGYSGAIKALHDSGILKCSTYIAGLSGSSWYLSSLYSHDEFPAKGPDPVNKEIRSNIESSPFWLLRPELLMRYSSRLRQKRKQGQPVTFTDFFGMLIGQTLLGKEKMEQKKLSDMQEKLKDASVPMPLFTCLHVRSNMSAMTFHDWVEFTPYEIGIAKYGTFLKTEEFGSKFFKGILVRKFDESPLHFLQGIWGSAFSILFNRLVDKNKSAQGSKSVDEREDLTKEMAQMTISREKSPHDENSDEEVEEEEEEDEDEWQDATDDITKIDDVKKQGRRHTWVTGITPPVKGKGSRMTEKRGSLFTLGSWLPWGKTNSQEDIAATNNKNGNGHKQNGKQKKSLLNTFVSNMFNSYAIMQTREFRAGKILNYMRGLSLQNTYPISPFSSAQHIAEENEFKYLGEAMECFRKKVHLVDSGLTFNSPYPPILRPQRAVDLIISFDFSARPAEEHQPFKEILLAEKWARLHNLPFPKIDPTVYDKEGMKECYVFRDSDNERAPIIIHFVLTNKSFQHFSKPGVARSPGDKSGKFKIFEDPKTPYSTYNFQYSNKAFDNLHSLVEYNTLLHIETIKEEIKHCISLRRHSKVRCSITLNDIRGSRHLSAKGRTVLEKAIEERGSVALD